MPTEAWVAIITVAGSIIGALLGAFGGMKLVEYRLSQLELKVDELKGMYERIYKLETGLEIVKQRVLVTEQNIQDIKNEIETVKG